MRALLLGLCKRAGARLNTKNELKGVRWLWKTHFSCFKRLSIMSGALRSIQSPKTPTMGFPKTSKFQNPKEVILVSTPTLQQLSIWFLLLPSSTQGSKPNACTTKRPQPKAWLTIKLTITMLWHDLLCLFALHRANILSLIVTRQIVCLRTTHRYTHTKSGGRRAQWTHNENIYTKKKSFFFDPGLSLALLCTF